MRKHSIPESERVSDLSTRSRTVPHEAKVWDLTGSNDEAGDTPAILPTAQNAPRLSSPCKGIVLEFPEGQTPHTSYPFAIHDAHQLAWGFTLDLGKFYLRSNQCLHESTDGAPICRFCKDLDENDGILQGIKSRIRTGVPVHAGNAYKPIGAFIAANRRLRESYNSKRLALFNANVKLGVRSRTIETYKRLVMAIANGGIRRVDAVLRVALRNGRGVSAVLNLIDRAAKGLYKPRDETEEEMSLSLLILRIGGTRLADIAHRTFGLAAPSTTRNRQPTEPLRVSVSLPTNDELTHNIRVSTGVTGTDAACSARDSGTPPHPHCGYVLMFDELKVEETVRWDPQSNKVQGICREHGHTCSLEFCDIDDIHALCDAVKEGTVHLAKEVATAICRHCSSILN